MIVYLVTSSYDYEDFTIHGVFTTSEKAQAYILEYIEDDAERKKFNVSPLMVDDPDWDCTAPEKATT